MCFVTYLPYQEGFILTSNRDEHVGRPKALPPKKYIINKQSVFYPQDGLAQGTWIAASTYTTLCLLNGAFIKHHHQPPYRQSRGLVLLDFYEYSNLSDFVENYQFSGIEPFTLIVVEEGTVSELRWDGVQLFHQLLDGQKSHAWSSVTLYEDEVIKERETWFESWQQAHPFYEASDVLDFHHFGGKGDAENDLLVNRNNELRTVSMSQIQKTTNQFLIHYWDKLNDQQYRYRIFDAERVLD
ncbi:MAG: NRDE family protein [Spirosomataceae bacterium]